MLDKTYQVGDPFRASDFNALTNESLLYREKMFAEHEDGEAHRALRFEQASIVMEPLGSGWQVQTSDRMGVTSISQSPIWSYWRIECTLYEAFSDRRDYGVIALLNGRFVIPVVYESMTAGSFTIQAPEASLTSDYLTILVYGVRHG